MLLLILHLEFKKAFDDFDFDNEGVISKEKLGAIMQRLGQDPTETDLNEMIEAADKNGEIILLNLYMWCVARFGTICTT